MKSKLEEKKSPHGPSDDEIISQQDRIADEIAKTQPLLGKQTSLEALEEEYKSNPKFLKKIQEVATKYANIRRIRGDGNCFYRSYLFGCLESIKDSESAIAQFAKHILASLDQLEAMGFPRVGIEDAHDNLIDILNWMKTETRSSNDIAEKFNDDGVDSYLVMYFRIMTSAQLQRNTKQYSPWLTGKVMSEFVKQEVEGMGKESDYVQCVALANEVGIPVRIEYVDPTDSALIGHVFPEKRDPKIFLLYRPGHYDIIYPKSTQS